MTIKRHLPSDRWSDAIIHQSTIYYTSIPSNLDADISKQTSDVLQDIEQLLQTLGSDKSRLLDVTIFLTDIKNIQAMNQIWDQWVIPGKAPVRCTVEAKLAHPQFLIEVKVVAAA